MEQIIAIALCGTILTVVLQKEMPQLSMLTALVTGILIFFFFFIPLEEVIRLLRETAERAGVSEGYFSVILKVIGIAYLSQFTAQLCLDAGERAIAAKVEMAGKVLIMAVSAPILVALLEMVLSLV